jgi:hypothetical protein
MRPRLPSSLTAFQIIGRDFRPPNEPTNLRAFRARSPPAGRKAPVPEPPQRSSLMLEAPKPSGTEAALPSWESLQR